MSFETDVDLATWLPRDAARLPLEKCICGKHCDCPDGWHAFDELPCSCTPDCALDEDEA